MKTIWISLFSLLTIACKFHAKTDDMENGKSSVDFLSACDSLRSWQGGVQGIDMSDSSGIYPMAECHTNDSYDLIWVPNTGILKLKDSVGERLLDYYHLEGKKGFKNLTCYAFTIRKTKHKSTDQSDGGCDCEDLDEYDYVFPSHVIVYKRIEQEWKQIATANIKSFEELGRLKLNTIFNK
jgi:hypothetical protein